MSKLPLYVTFWVSITNISSVKKPGTNENTEYDFVDTQSINEAK